MGIEQIESDLVVSDTVIANGGQTSGTIDLYGTNLLAFEMPSTFEGTTITIQASSTKNGTFKNAYALSADLVITVAANKYVLIDNVIQLIGLRYIKLFSNNVVGANRTIKVISKRL